MPMRRRQLLEASWPPAARQFVVDLVWTEEKREERVCHKHYQDMTTNDEAIVCRDPFWGNVEHVRNEACPRMVRHYRMLAERLKVAATSF